MKILVTVLLLILVALQYRIWFGDGSVQELWRLREQAKASAAEVQRLQNRNETLEAEVADLKKGLDAIEERARSELGMISNDETFYQFVRDKGRVSTSVVPGNDTPVPATN
ncbi:MAG: cell division protein FtsB [Gammaproteobacteria bacterium]|nr:cell division protein FtsB [Gammaproteobacteria bacterium]